jgi:hypothetical protein
MKKLNKRQIIILAIAALGILYAGYELLIARPAAKKDKTEATPVETAAFVNTISNDLLKNKVTGVDIYIAGKAETEWGKSPFWEKTSYREFVRKEVDDGGKGQAGPKIIYSGYVDIGNKKMAIINGWEYEAGDALEIEGYVLKRVTPSRVLLVNRKLGGELYVTIQE